jgi:hypothetical protein
MSMGTMTMKQKKKRMGTEVISLIKGGGYVKLCKV